jgi:hypothetical protein
LFGLFADRPGVDRAAKSLGKIRSFRFSLVQRGRYQALWRRALAEHTEPSTWPPLSRYS